MNLLEKFFRNGIKEMNKEVKDFEKEYSKTTNKLKKKNQEMECWEKNTRLIRKKDSRNK